MIVCFLISEPLNGRMRCFMSKILTVHMNEEPVYDIVLEPSFEKLKERVTGLGTAGKKLCIVTDSNVADLYLEEVTQMLKECCKEVHSFIFPAGEENKNLDTVRDLYTRLIEFHYDRNDMLVALGGGVAGDLCGFCAATYLRGVDFIQIPTTLLSQVDSSIGGKTGVDFDSYKNMVGAFHMPKLVYTNIQTLLTLSEEQFASGMGEIIKHGLIKDLEYYLWLSEHAEEIKRRDLAICEEMIYISDQIKKQVVEGDPKEKGERALLNFGHTLGHAIEKLMNFRMLHGHCVAVGCLAAAHISSIRGLISAEEVEQLQNVMRYFDLPVFVAGPDPNEVIKATKNDKKMEAGVIKFILLNSIGAAYVDRSVTEEEMKSGLEYITE